MITYYFFKDPKKPEINQEDQYAYTEYLKQIAKCFNKSKRSRR